MSDKFNAVGHEHGIIEIDYDKPSKRNDAQLTLVLLRELAMSASKGTDILTACLKVELVVKEKEFLLTGKGARFTGVAFCPGCVRAAAEHFRDAALHCEALVEKVKQKG